MYTLFKTPTFHPCLTPLTTALPLFHWSLTGQHSSQTNRTPRNNTEMPFQWAQTAHVAVISTCRPPPRCTLLPSSESLSLRVLLRLLTLSCINSRVTRFLDCCSFPSLSIAYHNTLSYTTVIPHLIPPTCASQPSLPSLAFWLFSRLQP